MNKKKKNKKQTEHLINVGAFYQNDTPRGIGIIIENTNFDLEERITNFISSYEEAWISADEIERRELVKTYFHQLDYFAQVRSEDRSPEQNFICIMNIWFLEKHGFLQSDNFNGCKFLYGNHAAIE